MSFDAIAPHYRWIERVTAGALLQRCRTEFIHQIAGARNILLLGEGRGRFLSELVRINPQSQITCVDASARMLELTHTELEKHAHLEYPRPSSSNVAQAFQPAGRGGFLVPRFVRATPKPPDALPSLVRFIHADIVKDNWDNDSDRYDAVASHFFLDCFRPEQLAQICSVVASRTVSCAPWLISDFCVPEKGWQRVRARWILWGLYRFFRVTTRLPATRLTPPDEHMEAAGFQLRTRKHFNHGLLNCDVWVKA